jgi:outer membrane protein, heavy metal efflux system
MRHRNPVRPRRGAVRRDVSRLAVVAALLAMSACRHVPSAPIDPAANAERLSARSLSDSAVTSALAQYGLAAPADSSWTLDQLTVAAWALRPDVSVARSEVEAAKADIRVQGLRPNPTLSLGPERVVSGTPGVSPWVLATALTFPLETGGKRGIRRDRAAANERVAEWQLGQVLWTARSELRNALFAREFATEIISLDEREASLRTDYLDWIDTRIKFGAGTTQDRFVASQALAEVQSRRGYDEAAFAGAAADLAAAVGLRPEAFAAIAPAYPPLGEIPEVALTDLAAARDLALVNRVDIRRALAEYEIAEQDLKAAIAKQYPDIGIGPGYLFDQGDHKITLTLDLPVPLFDNGGAAIDAAIAGRKVAAAKFDTVQAKALAEIDASFARYRANLKALAAATDAEAESRKTQESASKILEAGGTDRGVVLTAEIDLITRQKNTLDAKRAVVDSLHALEDAIERPIFPTSSLKPIGAVADNANEIRP